MPDLASHIAVLAGAAALAAVLGATIAHTNFCTMGAVADWVTTGDKRRFQSWLLAMAVAIAGTSLLASFGSFDAAATRIPYASGTLAWPRYLLGGLMFGVGMALCGGCPSKNLVRAGLGDGKAFVVLGGIAISAYLMTQTRFYELAFHHWMAPLYLDLNRFGIEDQRLPTLIGAPLGGAPVWFDGLLGFALAGLLMAAALRRHGPRPRPALLIGGTLIGAVITAGWWLTSGPLGQRWIEDAEFLLAIPPGIGVQSITFVSPLADVVGWLSAPPRLSNVTFGMAGLAGMVTGTFAYGLCRGRLHWEWFTSLRDFGRHLGGSILLGIGGVLALGCSIGQGITGISTLALGSVIAVAAMVLGSAVTIRTEYYRLVYTGDTGAGAAFIAAAADLHLLPQRWRRLAPLD